MEQTLTNRMSSFLEDTLAKTLAEHAFINSNENKCDSCKEQIKNLSLKKVEKNFRLISDFNGDNTSDKRYFCLNCYHLIDVSCAYGGKDYVVKQHTFSNKIYRDYQLASSVNQYLIHQKFKDNFDNMKQSNEELITCYGVYQRNLQRWHHEDLLETYPTYFTADDLKSIHVFADVRSLVNAGFIGPTFNDAYILKLTVNAKNLFYTDVDDQVAVEESKKVCLNNRWMDFEVNVDNVKEVQVFDVSKETFVNQDAYEETLPNKIRVKMTWDFLNKTRVIYPNNGHSAIETRLGEYMEQQFNERFPEKARENLEFKNMMKKAFGF